MKLGGSALGKKLDHHPPPVPPPTTHTHTSPQQTPLLPLHPTHPPSTLRSIVSAMKSSACVLDDGIQHSAPAFIFGRWSVGQRVADFFFRQTKFGLAILLVVVVPQEGRKATASRCASRGLEVVILLSPENIGRQLHMLHQCVAEHVHNVQCNW